jgi:GNAT superfamily N-acetyltransferase
MNNLSPGLTLFQLTADTPRDMLEQVRTHCLAAIKDAYGYDYRQDWHWDLDSLLSPHQSPYFSAKNGAFYALRAKDDGIIGTAAIRSLSTSPNIMERYGARYAEPDEVAYLCRVYVVWRHRKQGLGDFLVDLCRKDALSRGYRTMYFHCERDAKRLRVYWESQGFSCFAEDGMSAHYDGPLAAVAENAADTIAA